MALTGRKLCIPSDKILSGRRQDEQRWLTKCMLRFLDCVILSDTNTHMFDRDHFPIVAVFIFSCTEAFGEFQETIFPSLVTTNVSHLTV